MTTLSLQDIEPAKKHGEIVEGSIYNAEYQLSEGHVIFMQEELAAFLTERDAETSKRMTELENVFAAAKNLCVVKGRYHAEMVMSTLMEAIAQVELANRKGEKDG